MERGKLSYWEKCAQIALNDPDFVNDYIEYMYGRGSEPDWSGYSKAFSFIKSPYDVEGKKKAREIIDQYISEVSLGPLKPFRYWFTEATALLLVQSSELRVLKNERKYRDPLELDIYDSVLKFMSPTKLHKFLVFNAMHIYLKHGYPVALAFLKSVDASFHKYSHLLFTEKDGKLYIECNPYFGVEFLRKEIPFQWDKYKKRTEHLNIGLSKASILVEDGIILIGLPHTKSQKTFRKMLREIFSEDVKDAQAWLQNSQKPAYRRRSRNMAKAYRVLRSSCYGKKITDISKKVYGKKEISSVLDILDRYKQ